MKAATRDPKQAPYYAHWHVYVRFPSGLRCYKGHTDRTNAVAEMKADREMTRDGFPRYVAWCTCPQG